MNDSNLINEDLYKQILTNMPIPCVDLVFSNEKGYFLLLKRNNEPLKSKFWLPGGRMLKGESSALAASRKCKEELGLDIDSSQFDFMGFFEGNFSKNSFDIDGGYHVVSLVFLCTQAIEESEIILDEQSSEFKFSSSLPEEFMEYFNQMPCDYMYK